MITIPKSHIVIEPDGIRTMGRPKLRWLNDTEKKKNKKRKYAPKGATPVN